MLVGNDNIHESLDEFEIQSNLIRDHRVSCCRASKKSMLPLFLVSQLWLYLGNSQVSVYRTIGPLVVRKRFKVLPHARKSLCLSFTAYCWFLLKGAQIISSRVLDLNQSKADTFVGTPSYMSPELFLGKSYNHKVSAILS